MNNDNRRLTYLKIYRQQLKKELDGMGYGQVRMRALNPSVSDSLQQQTTEFHNGSKQNTLNLVPNSAS